MRIDMIKFELLKKYRSELRDIENMLRPPLTDYSLLPRIFDIVQHLDLNCGMKRKKTEDLRVFMTIALYFYSPMTFAGMRIKNGLRNAIGKLFPDIPPTTISVEARKVPFFYRTYETFRNKIDRGIDEVVKSVNW